MKNHEQHQNLMDLAFSSLFQNIWNQSWNGGNMATESTRLADSRAKRSAIQDYREQVDEVEWTAEASAAFKHYAAVYQVLRWHNMCNLGTPRLKEFTGQEEAKPADLGKCPDAPWWPYSVQSKNSDEQLAWAKKFLAE